NAVVDVGGVLDVNSSARMPNQVTFFLQGLVTPGDKASDGDKRVGQAWDDANSVVRGLRTTLEVLKSISSINGELAEDVTNVFTASTASAKAGKSAGVAGAVAFMTFDNAATSYIDQGALVNQNIALAPTQDVHVHSFAQLDMVDLSDQINLIKLKD